MKKLMDKLTWSWKQQIIASGIIILLALLAMYPLVVFSVASTIILLAALAAFCRIFWIAFKEELHELDKTMSKSDGGGGWFFFFWWF